MQKSFLIAIFAALISGIAIGTQSSFTSTAGKVTGPILAGLLINFAAGASAGLFLFVVYIRKGNVPFSAIQAPTWGIILISGLLGIGVITGIAYSLPKIGIAAGLSTIFAGQMTVAVLVDTFGLTGGEPIPLNLSRIGGLALLALGTWFILPKG
jgi:transporter family-2 protein